MTSRKDKEVTELDHTDTSWEWTSDGGFTSDLHVFYQNLYRITVPVLALALLYIYETTHEINNILYI